MSTVSPTWTSSFSEWALYLLRLVTYLPNSGAFTRRVTCTTTVFCILSEVTTPTSCRRWPRLSSFLVSSVVATFLLLRAAVTGGRRARGRLALATAAAVLQDRPDAR